MSQRDTNMLWLKDIIDHMRSCHQQLQWAEDAATVQVLTEAMLRDLESCRRLCESLSRQRQFQHV